MKALRRGTDKPPAQIICAGEGHGMHEDVDAAKRLGNRRHGGIHLRLVLHIHGHHGHGAVGQLGGELAHIAFDPLALKREGHTCALGVETPRNRPRDAAFVGDAHHEGPLSVHQSAHEFLRVLDHATAPRYPSAPIMADRR